MLMMENNGEKYPKPKWRKPGETDEVHALCFEFIPEYSLHTDSNWEMSDHPCKDRAAGTCHAV